MHRESLSHVAAGPLLSDSRAGFLSKVCSTVFVGSDICIRISDQEEAPYEDRISLMMAADRLRSQQWHSRLAGAASAPAIYGETRISSGCRVMPGSGNFRELAPLRHRPLKTPRSGSCLQRPPPSSTSARGSHSTKLPGKRRGTGTYTVKAIHNSVEGVDVCALPSSSMPATSISAITPASNGPMRRAIVFHIRQ